MKRKREEEDDEFDGEIDEEAERRLEEEDRAIQRQLEEDIKKELLKERKVRKRLRPSEPDPESWVDKTASYISSIFSPPKPEELRLRETQEEANELLREIFDGDYSVIPKRLDPIKEHEQKLKMAKFKLERAIDEANLYLYRLKKAREREVKMQKYKIDRLARETRGAEDLGKDIVGFGRYRKIIRKKRKRPVLRKGSKEAIAYMNWVRSYKQK